MDSTEASQLWEVMDSLPTNALDDAVRTILSKPSTERTQADAHHCYMLLLGSLRHAAEENGWDPDLLTPISSPVKPCLSLHTDALLLADLAGEPVSPQNALTLGQMGGLRRRESLWTIPVSLENIEPLRSLVRAYRMTVTPEAAARLKAIQQGSETNNPATPDAPTRTMYTGDPDAFITLTPKKQVLIQATPSKPMVDAIMRIPSLRWNDAMRGWIAPYSRLSEVIRTLEPFDIKPDATAAKEYAALVQPFTFDGTLPGLRALPLTLLSSVDEKKAERFKDFGVENLFDLIMLIPRRYIDRSDVQSIRTLTPGTEAAFIGKIDRINADTYRRMVHFDVSDGTGSIRLTFFNALWQAKRFRVGDSIIISGKVDEWVGETRRMLQIANPMMDPLSPEALPMIPIYPQSAKSRVTTWEIHQAIREVLSRVKHIVDPMPAFIKEQQSFMDRHEALKTIHLPNTIAETTGARTRLAFDELLCLQSALLLSKYGVESEPGIPHASLGTLTEPFIENIPFSLTNAQERVIAEIKTSMAREHPMHILVQGDVGSGKAQPLSSLILTPTGFKRMGDIKVGDEIVNPEGGITNVTGVFPQGERQVYKVTFKDGSVVRADGEHLWNVRTSAARHRGRKAKVLTTLEIKDSLTERNGALKWHVELPKPMDLDSGGDRPVDPYLLGIILGDGSTRHDAVNLTSMDIDFIEGLTLFKGTEIRLINEKEHRSKARSWGLRKKSFAKVESIEKTDIETITSKYEEGYTITQLAESTLSYYDFIRKILVKEGIHIRSGPDLRNPLVVALDSLGLMNKLSYDKYVPEAYLNAPITDRHAILQGLLDTDGTLDTRVGNNVSFSSVSQELAENVAWLARSLGGRARCVKRTRKSGISWYTSMQLPPEFEPFRLERKRKLYKGRTKYVYPAKAIQSIEPDGVEQVQCISVMHPNQLYITDDFTITHNTLVSLVTLLTAVENGYQGALMAPTEILTTQLYEELLSRSEGILLPDGTPLRVQLFTNKLKGKARVKALEELADGTIHIAVGTHALIVGDIQFKALTAVVIDEQHRFGVEQRAALRAKGKEGIRPDMLVMTATPIPRTAAMTVFGDLDVAIIDELPPGRTPIKTEWLDEEPNLNAMFGEPWSSVRAEIDKGHQAYVVCPLVEESEKLQVANATETYEALSAGALSGLRLGLVHGQQKAEDRNAIMDEFRKGALDVIVATTVIEVGVNVPNSTAIVILDCNRFGIAQLHQLRGRVGRGKAASKCILVGRCFSQESRTRMEALCESTDGFYLSEVDLALRGHGSVFGTQQSGVSDLKVADLERDRELLAVARRAAAEALELDPGYEKAHDLKREIIAMLGDDAEAWLGKS